VQVHYDEGVAIYIGPEPCVGVREDGDEALETASAPGDWLSRLNGRFKSVGNRTNALSPRRGLRRCNSPPSTWRENANTPITLRQGARVIIKAQTAAGYVRHRCSHSSMNCAFNGFGEAKILSDGGEYRHLHYPIGLN
jgi:hypothetical protein